MAYVIAEPCIGTKDNSCVEVCPVDCIHPTPDEPDYDAVEMLYIDPDECIDCDACVEACPVDACFAEDQLPDEWQRYAQVNAEDFTTGGRAWPQAGRPPAAWRGRFGRALLPSGRGATSGEDGGGRSTARGGLTLPRCPGRAVRRASRGRRRGARRELSRPSAATCPSAPPPARRGPRPAGSAAPPGTSPRARERPDGWPARPRRRER